MRQKVKTKKSPITTEAQDDSQLIVYQASESQKHSTYERSTGFNMKDYDNFDQALTAQECSEQAQNFNGHDESNQVDQDVRNTKDETVDYRIGTWEESKASEIEQYLIDVQRKFAKYRLNIFVLNKCALQIQHIFFKAKAHRIARAAREAQEIAAQELIAVRERALILEAQRVVQEEESKERKESEHVTQQILEFKSEEVEHGSLSPKQQQQLVMSSIEQMTEAYEIQEQPRTQMASYMNATKSTLAKIKDEGPLASIASASQESSSFYKNSNTPQFKMPDAPTTKTEEMTATKTTTSMKQQQVKTHAQRTTDFQNYRARRGSPMTTKTAINNVSANAQILDTLDISEAKTSKLMTNSASKSSFMAGTKASKSRAAEISSGSKPVTGRRQSQNSTSVNSVASKTIGGAKTTTTTTTTTTTYSTTRGQNQSINKSKSTERFQQSGVSKTPTNQSKHNVKTTSATQQDQFDVLTTSQSQSQAQSVTSATNASSAGNKKATILFEKRKIATVQPSPLSTTSQVIGMSSSEMTMENNSTTEQAGFIQSQSEQNSEQPKIVNTTQMFGSSIISADLCTSGKNTKEENNTIETLQRKSETRMAAMKSLKKDASVENHVETKRRYNGSTKISVQNSKKQSIRSSQVQSACSAKDEAVVVNKVPKSREFSMNSQKSSGEKNKAATSMTNTTAQQNKSNMQIEIQNESPSPQAIQVVNQTSTVQVQIFQNTSPDQEASQKVGQKKQSQDLFKSTKTTTVVDQSSNQTHAQSMKAFTNIKSLDIEAVLNNKHKIESQMSRNDCEIQFKTSIPDPKKRVDINLSRKLEKNRSLSQLSERSTFSMEQKKKAPVLSNAQIATYSLSRFQERQRRLGSREAQTLVIDKKIEWKELPLSSPKPQKSQLTDEERKELKARQQASISKLTQHTTSSKLKRRDVSAEPQSADQDGVASREGYSSVQNDTVTLRNRRAMKSPACVSKQKEIAFGYSTGRTSQLTSRLDSHTKQQLSTRSTSRINQTARNIANRSTTTTTTTITKTYVSGKEQTSSKTMQSRNKSQSAVQTPRIIKSKSVLQMRPKRQTKETELNQTTYSPRRQRDSFQTYNQTQSTVNQQGKAHAKTTTSSVVKTKSSARAKLKIQSSEVAPSITNSNQESPSKSLKQSIQAGAMNELSMQSQSEDKMTLDQIVVEDVADVSLPSYSSSQRKKQSSSFNATSSTKKNNKFQPRKQGSGQLNKDQQDNSGAELSQKSLSHASSYRGIPMASELRAAIRKEREMSKQDSQLMVETDGVEQTVSQDEIMIGQSKRSQTSSSIKQVTSSTKPKEQESSSVTSKKATQRSEHQVKHYSEQQHRSKSGLTLSQQESDPIADDKDSNLLSQQSQSKDEDQYSQLVYTTQQMVQQVNELNESYKSQGPTETANLATLQKHRSAVVGQDGQQQQYQEQVHVVGEVMEVESHLVVEGGPAAYQTSQSVTSKSGLATSFKEDSPAHLAKCLETDLSLSKIQKDFRKEYSEIKTVLLSCFYELNAIFLFYAGQSYAYPAIAVEDFQIFVQERQILIQNLMTEGTLMKCFTETIQSTNNLKQKGEKQLNRYEFLEILVRFASVISKSNQHSIAVKSSVSQTLRNLLELVILPNAQQTNRSGFIKMLTSDDRITELLTQNEPVLQIAFKYFTHEKKKKITLEECVALAKQCQLDVPDQMLGVVFAESLVTVFNTMKVKERMYNLSYSEFIYFLCRITYAHFENTVYDSEDFFIKLDNLLDVFLEPFSLAVKFTYGARFNYDMQAQDQISHVRQEVYNEGIQEVDDDEEITACQVETRYAIPQHETPQHQDIQDGDIQAWPQPCPMAYPQRQEMIKSPAISAGDHTPEQSSLEHIEINQMSEESKTMNATETDKINNPSGHSVQVVERRYKQKTASSSLKTSQANSATKTRSYLTSQNKVEKKN